MNKCLVDYSSDDEYGEIEEIHDQMLLKNHSDLKRNQSTQESLLPVPLEIRNMFAENDKVPADNSEKYGGKIRSFPHERGVWATYIYIQYEAEPNFLEMIKQLKKRCEEHEIILSNIDNFHISLSKTLKLRHHCIEPLIKSLRVHLRRFVKFKIMFQSLEVYENEEKTRTFIGLKVHSGYDYLCEILEKVDLSLSEFNLPLFYKNPSFHLSCASCIGSKAEQIDRLMADLNDIFVSFTALNPSSRILWASVIYCKAGDKLFQFPLK